MPSRKRQKHPASKLLSEVAGPQYRGKQAKTGNSQGFRFDRAFFKSHAEFNDQEVQVTVIAPGRALISVDLHRASAEKEDPLISTYLAFLSKEIIRHPETIRPLDTSLVRRMRDLTRGITVDAEDDLGEETLL
jgi:prlF antitoxin for toxin YhaV_toxin